MVLESQASTDLHWDSRAVNLKAVPKNKVIPPSAIPKLKILWLGGELMGQRFMLEASDLKRSFSVGRDEKSDICLLSKEVSKKAVLIKFSNTSGWTLETVQEGEKYADVLLYIPSEGVEVNPANSYFHGG